MKVLYALKIFCDHLFISPLTLTAGNQGLFHSIFFFFWNVLLLDSWNMYPFQVNFFHLVICIQLYSMSLASFLTHFFLAVNTIPWPGCTRVSLSIHLPWAKLLEVSICTFSKWIHLILANVEEDDYGIPW